jgi:hypothetical protein
VLTLTNPPAVTLDDDGINISEVGVSLEKEGDYRKLNVYEQTTRKREDARRWLALIVVASLAFIVVASFVSLWYYSKINSIDDIVKVIDAVTSPVIGIVGAVTGFYFGESQSKIGPRERNNGEQTK